MCVENKLRYKIMKQTVINQHSAIADNISEKRVYKHKYNKELDYFRAILIGLVILVHIVNFGELYPSVKNAILAFLMPTFLIITGYLVNINKTVRAFLCYLSRIWLPYMIFVMGFAVLSLYLPVRDGIKTFNVDTIVDVLFVRSIGPYWFLYVMIVCGIIYFSIFHFFHKANIVTKLALFASALILVSLFTPILSIKAATYYFIGVVIKQLLGDFSMIYRKSIWAIIPFGLLVSRPEFQDWGTIAVLFCVISFLSFSSFFFSILSGKTKGILEYIGRNTFPIYIFHPIFTMLSKFMLPVFRFDPTGIIHSVLTISLGIIGCIFIAKCFDLSCFCYLLGRKRILR